MEKLALRSGVKETRFNRLRDEAGDASDDLYEDVLSLYECEWREAHKVWIAPGFSDPAKAEEVWLRYDMLELTGTYEQELLQEKLDTLKDALIKVFRKWLKRKH